MSDIFKVLQRTAGGLSGLGEFAPAIVGSVDEGAIIEYGSNANGDYIKFTNGLQFCISTISLTDLNIAPDMTVFQKSQYTPPAAFIGTYDMLIASARATNNDSTLTETSHLGIVYSGNSVSLYNTGNSGAHVYPGTSVREGGQYNILSAIIRVVAIGRWK